VRGPAAAIPARTSELAAEPFGMNKQLIWYQAGLAGPIPASGAGRRLGRAWPR
jgi:hypothetical protein